MHAGTSAASTTPFADRAQAGQELAVAVAHLRGTRPSVLALPRGGVPVAVPVAAALDAPLDVIVVRKVALPTQPELALGAVTWEGTRAVNPEVLRALRVPLTRFELIAAERGAEVVRRTRLYRGTRPFPDVRDRTVVLVDDGVATGATVRAAVAWLRRRSAARVVLAVPVIAEDAARDLRMLVDELVALRVPVDLRAVGCWYDEFAPVEDDEVVRALAAAAPPTT